MNVDLFDFHLPQENIALRPACPRDSARMLVVKDGQPSDACVGRLADFLKAGDILVFNDTKVIPGRLHGKRGEAKMQVTLHKRETDDRWRVFAKPAKKCRVGDVLDFNGLIADVIEAGEEGERTLQFRLGEKLIWDALLEHGTMPLPPYIASQRPVDDQDDSDYQTIYAEHEGAVAAPTAGLHFTPEMLESLKAKGVETVHVTLHVGAGTFLPVKVEDTEDHKMHSEYGVIPQAAADKINTARSNGGRVVSVGTTSLRLLESATGDDGVVKPFGAATDIFISPGYSFRAVDVLMTNFHLPKSTLFMLVSAFCGLETMQNAYKMAIDGGYRFYSYGDSSLLFPEGKSDD
jgi:S-adenosylmethionine:tRNA ribosyltransferase-isomerase